MTKNNCKLNPLIWDKLTKQKYLTWYKQSIEFPEIFWSEQANRFITWDKTWDNVCEGSFTSASIKWFSGAKLNVSYNCIDRHLPEKANDTAILWQGDDPKSSLTINYQMLHDRVCQFANGLKKLGVKKGDTLCIYLPMIPEAAYIMLACARIGAVHSVVFAGFSAQALKSRIENLQASFVITADVGIRGGKITPLKEQVNKAVEGTKIKKVLVIKSTQEITSWNDERDIDFLQYVHNEDTTCEPESMDSEDPLFVLYTSGSTGTPKGVLHTQGGYLCFVAMTFRYVFDYQPKDVFWCTADVGWVTGHSYVIYGPLALGATTLMFEGVPTYPNPSRFFEIIDQHKVTHFYTAPTAIRALMAKGDSYVTQTSRKSLRVLGTVGEPINPEAWRWYRDVVGFGTLPIVDTWWQTETGGILLAPLIGISKQSPGSAGLPFFGIIPQVMNEEAKLLASEEHGLLTIAQPWPGIMRTIYGDHERFIKTYFSQIPNYYFTGDGAFQDSEGEYWITGRIDDVLNISGHRLGTAEIESALVLHHSVAEAAVVGIPDPIKGQNTYAFVTLKEGIKPSSELENELKRQVQDEIGKIAIPKYIQWSAQLPKTRSGKIMRRLLRKIANNQFDDLGDVSTLADAEVVQKIISDKKAIHSTFKGGF